MRLPLSGLARLLLTAVMPGLLSLSCDHKDVSLTPLSPQHVVVDADYVLEWEQPWDACTDWANQWPSLFGKTTYESLRPAIPTGLRVVAYNEDGNIDISNIPAEGGKLNLRSGNHSLLFYNNDTEYIVFGGLERFSTATATTGSRVRSTYFGNPFDPSRDENTVNPPDILFGHYIDGFYFDMSRYGELLPVTMRPLVFTYLVRYEFSSGLEHVMLARGALSGMAASVSLNSGKTSPETATVLYDCTIDGLGVLAEVRSFGVPDFPNPSYARDTHKYGLNLEVRLSNGKILNFDFDVTDQVSAQPHGGIITVKDIVIPADQALGGGGFNVDVTDWGEYQDIPMQF